jgi:hypothetical protein
MSRAVFDVLIQVLLFELGEGKIIYIKYTLLGLLLKVSHGI